MACGRKAESRWDKNKAHAVWWDFFFFFRNGLILSWWTTSRPSASNAPSRQRRSTALWGRWPDLSAQHWWSHTKCRVQFLAPRCKKNTDVVGQVSQRDTKMIKGVEYLSRRWGRAICNSSAGRRLRADLNCANTFWESVKEMKPVVPTDRARDMKFYLNARKNFYWEWSKTTGGCPGSLWSLHLQRY